MGELIGGIFFILFTAFLMVKFFPKKIVKQARQFISQKSIHSKHDHNHHINHNHDINNKKSFKQKFNDASKYFAMDIKMVGKDIFLGILIASILMVTVPKSFWHSLFLSDSSEFPEFVILLWNAIIGIFIALIAFVCSVGNIVLAAVLWYGGISFGGVIAFILSDLITIPMLQVYKKYFGLKPMLYLFLFLFLGIISTALFLDYTFAFLDWIPQSPSGNLTMDTNKFEWNYKTILNLILIPFSVFYFLHGRKLNLSDKK